MAATNLLFVGLIEYNIILKLAYLFFTNSEIAKIVLEIESNPPCHFCLEPQIQLTKSYSEKKIECIFLDSNCFKERIEMASFHSILFFSLSPRE